MQAGRRSPFYRNPHLLAVGWRTDRGCHCLGGDPRLYIIFAILNQQGSHAESCSGNYIPHRFVQRQRCSQGLGCTVGWRSTPMVSRGESNSMAREDFSASLKDSLSRRVNLCCSNPGCGKPTAGPHTDPTRALNIPYPPRCDGPTGPGIRRNRRSRCRACSISGRRSH